MDDLSPGERFAGCRIEAVVGRGGMGVVYRATELALGRRVALKVVAPENVADAGFSERFGREVRHAASIDHPNIVPVYGAGQEGERLYLVMRYVDGTDLHALIGRVGRLEPARAAQIVAQLAAGLDAAHVAGLVHRDVKPANVLLTPSGAQANPDHVYLTDFGLTVEVSGDARMTTTGHWIGSVDYMAPEQLRAESVDARTDVYALGGVLHAALTGQAPFRRLTVPQVIAAHLDDPPPRPTDLAAVDRVFDAVVARALAKDPAERYGSAGDLGRAALAAVRGEHVTIGERVVARGSAAPSEDPTRRLPASAAPAPNRMPGGDDEIAPRARRSAARARSADGDVVVAPLRKPAAATRSADEDVVIAPRPRREAAAAQPGEFTRDAADPRRPSTAGTRAVRKRERAARRAARSPVAAAGTGASGRHLPLPAGARAPSPAESSPRDPAPREPAPGPAQGGLAAGRRHRSRRRVRITIAATAAAAVAIIAIATNGGAPRAVSASLSEDEIRTAAQSFAIAYGSEDGAALRDVLARNVRRVSPDGAQQGREGVLAVYRRQFGGAVVEDYELDELQIVPGAAGRAAGSYKVRRSGREDITGRVAFGVVREAGVARIALISTQPD